MARPEVRLEARLKATAAITALVVSRIWPDFRKNNTLPAIVWTMTSDTSIGDASGGDPGNGTMRLNVECFASTRSGAKALGDAVRDALSGWMDSNNDLWRLEQRTDDIGETLPGQTVPESLIDSQDYLVCYTY